jgi:hypothetical protein
MEQKTKKIEIVFSERGDSWIEDIVVDSDQSLNELLLSKGYEKFLVDGIDPDNSDLIIDGMSIRVKIFR